MKNLIVRLIYTKKNSADRRLYGFYRNNQPFDKGHVMTTSIRKDSSTKVNGLEYFDSEIAKSISSSVNGILTLDDLKNYKPNGKPLHANIYGFDGWTSPASTQGYLTLSTLKAIEMLDDEYDDMHKLLRHINFLADRDNITYDYGKNIKDFKGVDLDYIQEKVSLFNQIILKDLIFLSRMVGTAYMNTLDKDGLELSHTIKLSWNWKQNRSSKFRIFLT